MKTHKYSLRNFALTGLSAVALILGGWLLFDYLLFATVLPLLQKALIVTSGALASLLVLGIALQYLRCRVREAMGYAMQFEGLLNATPEAIVIVSKDGVIRLVNQRTEELFGYARDELVGQPVAALFTKSVPPLPDILGASLYSSTNLQAVGSDRGHMGRYKDGRQITLEVSSSPLATNDGFHIIHVIRDVTERQNSERRRTARQTVRRLLSEATTINNIAPHVLRTICQVLGWDGSTLWIRDRRTNALQNLDGWYAPAGKPAGALWHQRPCLFPSETYQCEGVGLANPIIWIADLTQHQAYQQLELTGVGGMRTALAYPIVMGNEVLGVLEMFSRETRGYEDSLTETVFSIGHQLGQFLKRKQIEEAIHESEARKTAILEASLDAIITTDQDGKIVECNPAAERMFGHSRNQTLGEELAGLILPASLAGTYRQKIALYQVTGGGLELEQRLELTARHGENREFPIEVTITRIRSDGPPLLTWYIRDLTERVQAEERLRRSEERYRQAQKMEAIGRLAGGIAHDFNNILTVINGCSELLLRDLEPTDLAYETLDIILKSGQRAASLVRQMLAFSRKQLLAPKVFDLNSVVADLNKMLERVIGEDIGLACVAAPELSRVKADPSQIEQVLMNLAVNARDAMANGGKLTIETADVELDESYVMSYPGVRPGRYVMLAVSDTGCGMSKEVQARLFEPFFTTKEPGKGTGLGLATVYGIINQSGGHVAVYSEPGKGSTFKIYLPAVKETAEVAPVPRTWTTQLPGTGTVLLVEDEDSVRTLSRRILQMNGYKVLEARHGKEALQVYEKMAEQVDLMVTDVVMPEMNGCELAKQLLLQRPQLKVLFTSGYTDRAVSRNGMLEDGAAFLQKPFTPGALAGKVRELLCAS